MALFERLRRNAAHAGLVLLCASSAASCRHASHDVVRIGVAGSFTDPTGLPMKEAAELAAEEINAAGGINGRRLELVIRDDYADPDSAVFIAGDLYDSDVSAVVGISIPERHSPRPRSTTAATTPWRRSRPLPPHPR